MKTKTNSFKAVEFMRKVRDELSSVYRTDREQYYNELKKSMAEFINNKSRNIANITVNESTQEYTKKK
ncbi:MAG: hypothetical protein WCP65_01645 [Bacteroidota bacterium]